ncbi:DUF7260 family protein [Saliphagus infecundisoli]|nr:hypothetical protein [Saliphagus infecundisoli]
MSGITDVALFIVISGFVMVLGALFFLPQVRDICAEESTRTSRETQAFDRFVNRVKNIETAPVSTAPPQTTTGHATAPVVASPMESGLDEIREAYRDTVMAVPHYEEDYGESLVDNVSEEFSSEIATVLTDGGQLTPPVQRAIITQACESRENRNQFAEIISEEEQSLKTADRDLTSILSDLDHLTDRSFPDQSYTDLETMWQQSRGLEDRIEAVLADRQAAIRSIATGTRFTDHSALSEYLYHSLSTTQPVLEDCARVATQVKTAQSVVIDSLTRRV